MTKHTHLVIGAGKMGGALLSGWINGGVVKPSKLAIYDPHPGEMAQSAIENGARHVNSSHEALEDVKVVLLAIKPQMFSALESDLVQLVPTSALVISIMAGTSLKRLQTAFPSNPVLRAMPNTPAAIGAGITAFTADGRVSDAQKKLAQDLLSAGGQVFEVESEPMIDIVTAVSGSGPAYVFYMVEALEAAAIKAGLPADIAPQFARQTIIGAGALLEASKDTAGDLRRAVTSPNGTTQAALDVLMTDHGLPLLMREAVKAALKRAKELSVE